jgi:excisionase family DNA binding protein
MTLLDEHLGKALSVKEVADYIGCDVKTVRKHYQELGGMRLGRHYLFFERSIVDAVSKRTKMDSPSAEGREAAGEGLLDEEGSAVVGSQDAAKARKRLERQDRHGLYR